MPHTKNQQIQKVAVNIVLKLIS